MEPLVPTAKSVIAEGYPLQPKSRTPVLVQFSPSLEEAIVTTAPPLPAPVTEGHIISQALVFDCRAVQAPSGESEWYLPYLPQQKDRSQSLLRKVIGSTAFLYGQLIPSQEVIIVPIGLRRQIAPGHGLLPAKHCPGAGLRHNHKLSFISKHHRFLRLGCRHVFIAGISLNQFH